MNDPRVISDQDLDLVDSDRLIEAMIRRHGAVVCAWQVYDRGRQGTALRWSDRHSAIGLIEDARIAFARLSGFAT